MKVLVIEDSKPMRNTLIHGLKKEGFAVDGVGDGLDGLDHAQNFHYDVIILDLMLPGMDGLTLLTNLRRHGDKTHVLILSATGGKMPSRSNGLCSSERNAEY
jgi:two-component system response regulator ArlR